MAKVSLSSQDLVAETLLIPLHVRALETQRPDALLRDEQAVAMVEQIDYDYSRIKLQAHDQVGIILRVQQFDLRARDFLARHPDAVVVHIGCGLDSRFERVAERSGRVEWYDLDLPEVMELRHKLVGEAPRGHSLACSMFDTAWLDTVSVHGARPFLFVAEGVLPYFEQAQVKDLVLRLKERFPGAELVCDAMTPLVVWLHNWELAFSRIGARLHWGLRDPRDVEKWGAGIRLLDKWYYFDRPEPRLGASRLMRYIPPLGKGSGVFHYQLGDPKGFDEP
jgi:O-methyltransferase involved in polyketide biosynthesis